MPRDASVDVHCSTGHAKSTMDGLPFFDTKHNLFWRLPSSDFRMQHSAKSCKEREGNLHAVEQKRRRHGERGSTRSTQKQATHPVASAQRVCSSQSRFAVQSLFCSSCRNPRDRDPGLASARCILRDCLQLVCDDSFTSPKHRIRLSLHERSLCFARFLALISLLFCQPP